MKLDISLCVRNTFLQIKYDYDALSESPAISHRHSFAADNIAKQATLISPLYLFNPE